MIEMTVPDISCSHCVRAVTEAVQRLDDGAKVDVDLATKRVRIDSAVPRERIAEALTEEGYPPQAA